MQSAWFCAWRENAIHKKSRGAVNLIMPERLMDEMLRTNVFIVEFCLKKAGNFDQMSPGPGQALFYNNHFGMFPPERLKKQAPKKAKASGV